VKYKKIFFKTFFLLLTLVLLFILKPYQSKPLDSNRQAHIFMLTTIEIWQESDGFSAFIAPIQTRNNKGDKYVHYYKRLEDKNGNNYYVSHPPFAFYLAAFAYYVSGQEINEGLLQWMLFFMLLLSVFLLSYIVKQEVNCKGTKLLLAQIFALISYVFVAQNLFLYSSHYFAESLGQFFLLLTIAAFYYYKESTKIHLSQILIFLSVFLLSYSDWMGFCFLLAVFVLTHKKRKKKTIKRLRILSFFAATSAYLLCFFQYLYIAGLSPLIKAIGIRFVERSGFFGEQFTDRGLTFTNTETWLLFYKQMISFFSGPALLSMLLILLFIFFGRKKSKKAFSLNLYLVLFTVLFYVLLSFSATASHYIYIAKLSIPISLFALIVFCCFYEKIRKKIVFISGLFLLIIPFTFLAVKEYQKQQKTDFSTEKQLASYAATINLQAQKNQAVFITPINGMEEFVIVYLSYVSKRNLAFAKDQGDAKRKAKELGKEDFIYLDLNKE
jgi:hypothetical protein